MTALSLARRRYLARLRIAKSLEAEGLRLWRKLDPSNLDRWSESLPRLIVLLAGAQLAAAQDSDAYIDAALAEQGVAVDAAGVVVPAALAGIASDGRTLDGLLRSPVFAAKQAIGQGVTISRAMATGQANLSMILRTQVADAGRVADGVAVAARPSTGYVRMLVGKTCPRCTILAGKFYKYSQGFQRHPRCDCIHVPTRGEAAAKAEGLLSDPREVFNSLTPAEQGRAFTKAGAQAIRDGADMNQVVNARRGMTAAGTTTEGTTRRGFAGQILDSRQRLMPERIYQVAKGRDEAISMLRQFGYIL